MGFLKQLIFNKETERLYCINDEGQEYANFPISFNYWRYDNTGMEHCAIENGTYPIKNDNDWEMEHGHYIGDSYGTGWVALNRENGKGFHGYGNNRSMNSGTYGCIRSENEIVEEVCRAIDEAIENGIEVSASVVGNVDEYAKFCLDDTGEQ